MQKEEPEDSRRSMFKHAPAPNSKKLTMGQKLPGDPTKEIYLKQLIRVNHAGEYGAKRIYAGQMDVLKNKEDKETIHHMAAQEEVHLAYFSKELTERRVRPTLLMPLWHMAGYALGAMTAMMGKKAAMACTVAVEEVIDDHYREQLACLGEDEKELKEAIIIFRKEELEHRDIGLRHKAEEAPGYVLLSSAIKQASKLAIWLSKRI